MSKAGGYRFDNTSIAIFARVPQPGQVKTRLARGIGNVGATRAYSLMAEQTVRRVSQARLAPVSLYATPHSRSALFQRWRREYGVALHQQPTGNLGRRMHHVLGQCLRKHQAAVIIGSDAPALTTAQIAEALQSLNNGADAVFIPCEDGGYALAGLSRRCLRLFTGIRWGSSRVMQTTRARAITSGMRTCFLQPTWDVDNIVDLRRARRSGLLE